ncbi:VOC family protein [Streptomyces sp. NPDC007856]|uniref:VOC family protein n=1 Tax=Streptomyces sp. NPDC007856 TaxID=3364781 RepID=UPI0036CF1C1C
MTEIMQPQPRAQPESPSGAAARTEAPSATHIPERYHRSVVPHIMVSDAEAAIAFYVAAFGAVEEFRLAHPQGGIMHAEIRIGESVLMLGDVSQGPFTAPAELSGTSVALHVFVPDVDELAKRAVAAGAELIQAPADQFHGDRTALLRDPSGHLWVFLTHLRNVSPEELLHGRAAAGDGHA